MNNGLIDNRLALSGISRLVLSIAVLGLMLVGLVWLARLAMYSVPAALALLVLLLAGSWVLFYLGQFLDAVSETGDL